MFRIFRLGNCSDSSRSSPPRWCCRHRTRARLQGEQEYAREAYSQSVSEMRQIHSRLDDIKQRQYEILLELAPLG